MLKIWSLNSLIFSIGYPNLTPEIVKTNVERIIFQTLHVFLAPKILELLHSYGSERVVIGKHCSLENILDFINKAESTVEECSFTMTSTLPRNLTVLDKSSATRVLP